VTCAAAAAEARGHVYDMLAAIFRRPLDAAQLERLRASEMLAAMSAAEMDPGADFTTSDSRRLLERLAVDYTQLFHGPGEHIAPFESIQLGGEGELMGPAAAAVRGFMAEYGFAVTAEAGELPDHISVELAFMAELARREAAARASGDGYTLDLVIGLQRRFLAEHLGRWADRLARKVRREAETSFYRAMAGLLADFVTAEQEATAT